MKLGSVLSRVVGTTGRAILEALIEAETKPDRLLALVTYRVKAEPPRLRAALTGRLTDRHRFLLRLHLGQYDALAKALEEIDAEVERDLGPDHFHKRSPEQQARHLAQQIAKLGFTCSLAPAREPVSV